MIPDPRSVAGKNLDIAGHAQLLVVGAGPSGLAAAIEGARHGLSVMLVDENPVSPETMGENVPLHYGQRIGGAARNRNAMMEAMLESAPELATAFEFGVEVRLSTSCWGLYVNRENLNWMPAPVAGLMDDETGSSLISFDQAIIATGRRDMGLAFPGWDQPGVMGATAAVQLATRYRALDGTRAVVLGTTAEALLDTLTLQANGIAIAAIVEQADNPAGPADLVERVTASGIEILCGQAVRGVETGLQGVTAARLKDRTIACDLVILGVGAVAVIDLLDAAGCRIAFDPSRGGFVPALDGQRTSLDIIQAVGDCAGIWPEKSRSPVIAEAEGRWAAASAAASLGMDIEGANLAAPQAAKHPAYDIDRYRKAWVRASIVEAPAECNVCLCEEVTAREILEVKPPRYLDWHEGNNRDRSLSALLGEGPPHPDQIKRLTRAGMGPCQGRRCREQVQTLLALSENLPLAQIPLAGYRAPVRPLPLSAAVPAKEDPAIGQQWDSWFGMPRQWVPYWDAEEQYTVASLATEKPHVSE